MKLLNAMDAANIFANMEGASRFSITLPKLPYDDGKLYKKIMVPTGIKIVNPWYGRVERILKVSGIGGNFKWENVVNNINEKQGLPRDFKEGSALWGERVNGVRIKEDGTDLFCYLRVCYPQTVSTFFLDGEEILDDAILGAIMETRTKSSPSDFITVKLIPNALLRINHEEYVIS